MTQKRWVGWGGAVGHDIGHFFGCQNTYEVFLRVVEPRGTARLGSNSAWFGCASGLSREATLNV